MPLEYLQPADACFIPKLDHRDRDFVGSFSSSIIQKFGSLTPTFPDEYDTDAGLWTPNQSEINSEWPNSLPQRYGCTNFTTGDLATDIDGILRDPAILEALTHANALGGYDVRQSLMVAKSKGMINGFYNVQAKGPLDFFDAIRLAMFSGFPEKRSVSIGTPWYPDWTAAANGAIREANGTYTIGVNSVPSPYMPELRNLDYTGLPWHNWKIKGWTKINGVTYLVGKPWMGKKIGAGGYLYFSRSTINSVMGLKYTIAFTATQIAPDHVVRIDMAQVDRMMSFIRTLIGFEY